jgi:hypothetical protein
MDISHVNPLFWLWSGGSRGSLLADLDGTGAWSNPCLSDVDVIPGDTFGFK